MRNALFFIVIVMCFVACREPQKLSSIDPVNWEKRTVKKSLSDSLDTGKTFLSIYSQIFIRNEREMSDLTATVSLHNPNGESEIYIEKATYYNTQGDPIRTYFTKPIFIKPMETVQIVIDGIDKEGGTGANFIFDWKKKQDSNDPIFEAVMISTYGQQGISIVTTGKKIN